MKEVILDPDIKLGDAAPGTPFALVALSYLVVLAVACLILGVIYWWA